MPFRSLARPQCAVGEAVSQFQRVLGWMEDFSKPRMVAGEEFDTIGGSDLEH